MNFPKKYWDELYLNNSAGWDIGYVSVPLKDYFDQLTDKSISILIPGAGKAWEAEYLYKQGFLNTFILDFSETAITEFKLRCPWFPDNQIIVDDFFNHTQKYDLIVEQTFFSSLIPDKRPHYVCTIHNMLKNNGKLVGLLFNHQFSFKGPPFGGVEDEYVNLFSSCFEFNKFDIAYNSIKPRMGRELFLLFTKRVTK